MEKDARTIARLRIDNESNRRLIKRMGRNAGTSFAAQVDELKHCLRQNQHRFSFQTTTYPAPKSKHGYFDEGHSEIATLVLSDWHGGSSISADETVGLNAYNAYIMSNRAYAIIDKFKRIFRGLQSMHKIEKIWLPILGDMINGSIHDELILTNDMLDIPATILVSRLLIIAVMELKTLGVPIEADCIVGNHPRLMEKMPAKKQAHMNLDYLVYTMLADKFEDDPQVTIRVWPGQFGMIDHMGHRFVFEHGYKAKDVTLHDRLRRLFDSSVYRAATGHAGASVDHVIIGDKHKAKDLPGCMVNGALTGSDEYGMSLRLEPIPAIQQMFGISRKQRKTFHYELDVTNIVSEEAENPMSRYTTEYMVHNGR